MKRFLNLFKASLTAMLVLGILFTATQTAEAAYHAAMYVSGDFNNWAADSMSYRSDLSTPSFLVTRQYAGVTGAQAFKFRDDPNDWLANWGCDGTIFPNATVTINYAGGNCTMTHTQTYWYTYVWKDVATGASRIAVLETTAEPVYINSLSRPLLDGQISDNDAVTINVNLNKAKSAQERVYIRYTTDNWVSDAFVAVTSFTGAVGSANIPAQPAGTTVKYYVLTTTAPLYNTDPDEKIDLLTIDYDNNGGNNYTYTTRYGTTRAGNWSDPATWKAGSVPAATQSVVVAHAVNLDTDAAVGNLVIRAEGTFNGGTRTLSISGNGSFNNSGTFNAQNGTIAFLANGTISGINSFNNVSMAGAVNFGNSSTLNGMLTLYNGGSVIGTPPAYMPTSGIVYAITGAYGIGQEWSTGSSGSGVPYDVTVVSGTAALGGSDNRTVRGDLTIGANATLSLTGLAELEFLGSVTNNGTLAHNNKSIHFKGASAATFGGTTATSLYSLKMYGRGPLTLTQNISIGYLYLHNASELVASDGSARVLTISTAIDNNNGTLTPADGKVLLNGSVNIYGTAITFNDLETGAITYFKDSTKTIMGDFILNSGAVINLNAATINYKPSSVLQYNAGAIYALGQEWSGGSGAGAPYNVLITNGTILDFGTGLSEPRVVLNDFTLNSGSTLRLSRVSGGDLHIRGDAYIAGTFQPYNRTVVYDGTQTQRISGVVYSGLTLNNSAGGYLGSDATVTGTLTLTSGALNVGTHTLRLQSYTSVTTGTFDSDPLGTVIYEQPLDGQNVLPGQYGYLVFNDWFKDIVDGRVKVYSTLTPGASYYMHRNSSVIEFNGQTAQQNIPLMPYSGLDINNPFNALMGTDLTVTGTLALTQGQLITGGHTLTLTGPVTRGVMGYLTAPLGVVNYHMAEAGQMVAIGHYGILNFNGYSKILEPAVASLSLGIEVEAVFNPGTATHVITDSVVAFVGDISQAIPPMQPAYFGLGYDNPDVSTLTGDVIVQAGFGIATGTLDVGGHVLTLGGLVYTANTPTLNASTSTVNYTQETDGQALIPATYLYLNLSGGSKVFPPGGAIIILGTFNPGTTANTVTGSTVHYAAAAAGQNVAATQYHNLTFSGGVKTIPDGIIHISGTWIPGLTTDISTGTLRFNGSSAQTLPDHISYYNLTANNAAGVTGSLEVKNLLWVEGGTLTSHSDLHDVTIAALATLNAGDDFTVSGSWSNSGVFNPGTYTVTFDGGAMQTISGATTFNVLDIQNTAGGVILTSPAATAALLNVTTGRCVPAAGSTWQDVEVGDSGVLAPAGDLTLTGNLKVDGQFQVGTALVTFNGGVTQTLTTAGITFHDLSVASGTLLDAGQTVVTLTGSLTNQGVIREQRVVAASSTITYPLNQVLLDVTDAGTFSQITFERRDQNHPDRDLNQETGRYWTASADGTGTVALTLPQANLLKPSICRFAAEWQCDVDSQTTQTVTLNAVENIVGDWTVGFKFPLTVTAQNASRAYGTDNPAFTATYTGFIASDTAAVLEGTLTFGGAGATAQATTTAGNYAIMPEGYVSDRYDITYMPGTLTITKAPLQVTADDYVRYFGEPNPKFTARYAGFVAGETEAVLGGKLIFTGTGGYSALVTEPGDYVLHPEGLTSPNYDITYVDGLLKIIQGFSKLELTDATQFLTGDGKWILRVTFQVTPVEPSVVPVVEGKVSVQVGASTCETSVLTGYCDLELTSYDTLVTGSFSGTPGYLGSSDTLEVVLNFYQVFLPMIFN